MQRELVDSSCVRAVGYDADSEVLEIEFHSRKVYVYYAMPKQIVEEFLSSNSLGGFYNEKIKGVFDSHRMS